MKVIVIAGNYREFCYWCSENHVARRDPNVIYASGPQRLRGLRGPLVVLRYGTYYERRDLSDIEGFISVIERTTP